MSDFREFSILMKFPQGGEYNNTAGDLEKGGKFSPLFHPRYLVLYYFWEEEAISESENLYIA